MAQAVVSHGEPGSLLLFPLISVEAGVDTLVRLTNAGDSELPVRCAYVDGSGNRHATASFLITLTPRQPIAWLAGQGAPALPVDGVNHVGIDGSVNSGSIPPVPVSPFSGTLRCVAAEPDGTPTASDTLLGNATLQRAAPGGDSAAYTAIGFRATGTSADTPDVLVLGSPQAEYDACPEHVFLQPFLDGARINLGSEGAIARATATTVVLATCSSAPNGGAAATVDLTLTNEFGMQFQARRAFREHLATDLSRLDGTIPSMSIFNSAVAGSATGNLHMTPTSPGSGIVAIALTAWADPGAPGAPYRTAIQGQFSGARIVPDLVDLSAPGPACAGDCDADGTVAINELVGGVAIALGSAAVNSCSAFDTDGSGAVTVAELVAAVAAALTGCSP
ncbi:MAG: hypothetical protein AB7V27_08825 [Candidatus Binatia bacterium]